MKDYIKKYTLLILIFVSTILNAQESFAPFHKGDIFVYLTREQTPSGIQYRNEVKKISDEVVLPNGKKYFFHDVYGTWVRYDSVSSNILTYFPGTVCGNYIDERVVDSLGANLNDSIKFCHGDYGKLCTFSGNRNIIGTQRLTNHFSTEYISLGRLYLRGIAYSKGMGVTYFGNAVYQNSSYESNLIAALINGVIYGDTSLISAVDTENPKYFPLSAYSTLYYVSIVNDRNVMVQYTGKDSIINAKRYVYNTYEQGYMTFDTLRGNVVKYNPLLQCNGYIQREKVDSLKASLNDTTRFCSGVPDKIFVSMKDTVMFGNFNTKLKTFAYRVSGKTLYKTYAQNLGLMRYDIIQPDNSVETFRMKGVRYGIENWKGDTSTIFFDFSQPQVINTGYSLQGNTVKLNWSTNYEYSLEKFMIQEKHPVDNYWIDKLEVTPRGFFSNYRIDYSAKINIEGWHTHNYRIKLMSKNDVIRYFDISSVPYARPESYKLYQNYPNPFNPSTKISFDLKDAAFTSLKVFDNSGKLAATLVTEMLQPGNYTQEFNLDNLPSGIYFYTLNAGEFTETKKMILVK